MANDTNSPKKQIKAENLSQKSQAKLAEIKKIHGFKTDAEAIAFMMGYFGKEKA